MRKSGEKLEARAGIEPAHKGFADLCRIGPSPSVYAGSALQMPNLVRLLSDPQCL